MKSSKIIILSINYNQNHHNYKIGRYSNQDTIDDSPKYAYCYFIPMHNFEFYFTLAPDHDLLYKRQLVVRKKYQQFHNR